MSQFTTSLIAELVGKNKWKVYEKFEYHIGSYPSQKVVEVPVGFITDFASVPRIFWFLISPIDKHGKAAVIHDYLYYTKIYSRKEADKIFLECLKVLGVTTWKQYTMYYAVRYFGWWAWYMKRRK